MNLKLLSRLKCSDSAQLVLIARPGNKLEYYLVSRSVVYDIICTGFIDGTIRGQSISFDIRMSSLVPMIEKGYKFVIHYGTKGLVFKTEDGKIELTPSYVESRDANTVRVIENYMAFSAALEDKNRRSARIDTLTDEIAGLKAQHRDVSLMHLSGGPSSDPFTPDVVSDKIDGRFLPEIQKREEELMKLSKVQSNIAELDMSVFQSIASAASRCHTLVDLCGDYAICALTNSFLLQKGVCPVQSMQGQLFYQLIRDGNGEGFYEFNEKLLYVSGGAEKSVVMIAKYLPNNTVDSSIVLNGAVEEKYSIELKGVLSLATIVKSSFDTFALDLGNAEFVLSNELGEVLRTKFEVKDANTVKMAKLLRGEKIQGDLTMATIVVPEEVQPILSLFKENLTIYIKKKKIIFQSGGLYLVFGR